MPLKMSFKVLGGNRVGNEPSIVFKALVFRMQKKSPEFLCQLYKEGHWSQLRATALKFALEIYVMQALFTKHEFLNIAKW